MDENPQQLIEEVSMGIYTIGTNGPRLVLREGSDGLLGDYLDSLGSELERTQVEALTWGLDL